MQQADIETRRHEWLCRRTARANDPQALTFRLVVKQDQDGPMKESCVYVSGSTEAEAMARELFEIGIPGVAPEQIQQIEVRDGHYSNILTR